MSSLHCPTCHREFSDKYKKYRHIKQRSCVPPQAGVAGNQYNTTININPPAAEASPANQSASQEDGKTSLDGVLDFDKISTDAVMRHIEQSPNDQARLREAFECGMLQEELTRQTYFGGPPENRSIVGIDAHGWAMKVVFEGTRISTDARQALPMIASNNVMLANSEVVRRVLNVTEKGDVLTTARNARERSREIDQLRGVILNGGRYIKYPLRVQTPYPSTHRKHISTRTRNSIASQQGWTCNICGQLLTSCFDIDHVVALCRGGADSYENLQALCVPCHRYKTASERCPGRT